jgi:hypothetical protein
LVVLLATATAWPADARAAAQEDPSPAPLGGDAEREAFLLEGEVVKDEPAPRGITFPRFVTLRRGEYEHRAVVQTRDEYRSRFTTGSRTELDFRDSWRHNVAAYRLDRLLGQGLVPVAVVREYRRKPAAWSWFVDNLLMSDRERFEQEMPPAKPLAWICQRDVVRVFDQLIYNFDRTRENLLIDEHWQIWMIDHGRAFKFFADLRNEEELPARCEKHLLAGLRRLDRPVLEKTMEGLLEDRQIDGLLARRDTIVRIYDDAIAARGESAVLYEVPPRLVSTAERH